MQTWQIFFWIDIFGKRLCKHGKYFFGLTSLAKALEIEAANQWKAIVEEKMESLKRNNM